MENNSKECCPNFQIWYEALKIWNDYNKQITDFCRNNDKKEYDKIGPFENFDKILDCLLKYTCNLSQGTSFYRARAVSSTQLKEMKFTHKTLYSNGIYGFHTKNMGAPPKGKGGENRANSSDIAFLYLASKPERACSEIRPVYQSFISLAEFELQQNVTIVNLVNNSYKSSNNLFDHYLIGFIMNEFTKPVTSEEKIEYAPSQYIAWKLKQNNIAGIKYGFTDETCEEYNLVLFDEKLAKPKTEYSSFFQCIEQKYSFIDLNSSTPDKIIQSDFSLKQPTLPEWQESISDLIQKIKNPD